MYHPALGRFMTIDPIGFAAGDVNLYRMVSNNPINGLDPSGLSETRQTLTQKFAKTVEDWPVTFTVNHTKMQALRERYAKAGVNVDDFQHLRGVHPIVHQEISEAQDAWKRRMMNQMGLNPAKVGDSDKFWKTVDMAEVAKFEADIDATYGHLMIKSGAKKADVAAVLAYVDGAASAKAWMQGKANRFQKALPWTASALGIFALAGDARAAAVVSFRTALGRDEPPAAKAAWGDFEQQYRGLILKAAHGGRITYFDGINMTTAIDKYLGALGFTDEGRSKIVTPLRGWCDLNLHP